MSQAGILDVEASNPQIPTSFVTDSGIAIPLANILEILGATVAAGTSPLSTSGSGNTVTIEAQISQAIAAPDATKVGVANFDSAGFSVDANGFVTLTGGGGATSYTTDSGSAVPAAGILTVIGSGGITTSGAGSTLTIVGSGEQVIAITALDNTDSPYTVLTADYYMTCDVSAGALTIRLPNVPTTGKVFIVKDAGGDSATNNITVTTVGGVVNIDGATSFIINTNYRSLQFVFTGAAYEIF